MSTVNYSNDAYAATMAASMQFGEVCRNYNEACESYKSRSNESDAMGQGWFASLAHFVNNCIMKFFVNQKNPEEIVQSKLNDFYKKFSKLIEKTNSTDILAKGRLEQIISIFAIHYAYTYLPAVGRNDESTKQMEKISKKYFEKFKGPIPTLRSGVNSNLFNMTAPAKKLDFLINIKLGLKAARSAEKAKAPETPSKALEIE